jgi:zinc protease
MCWPALQKGAVTMRHLAGLVILVVLAAPAFAHRARADDVTTFKLANGLEGVVIEDHRAPVVVNRSGTAPGRRTKSAGRQASRIFWNT